MVNGNEIDPEETGEERALPDELEAIRKELAELKRENDALITELSSRETRISELEQELVSRDSEIAALEQAIAELEEKFHSVSEDLLQAVSSYKALVVQANPGIIEELITGDSIEQVNESVERARALVSRVRRELEAEVSKTRVPVGAPARTLPDLSALSPRDKIQFAIGGRK